MSDAQRTMRALLLAGDGGETQRSVRSTGLGDGEVAAEPMSALVVGAESYLSHVSAAPEKSNDRTGAKVRITGRGEFRRF